MTCRRLPLLSLFLLCGLAAGCHKAPPPNAATVDPVVAAVLAQPLMGDPDLTMLDRGSGIYTGELVPSAPIPPDRFTDEAKAAARSEAAALAGGTLDSAPGAAGADKARAGPTAMVSWAQAFGDGPCVTAAGYGFGWAAQMPAAVPIYPRAHVQEAAGADGGACRLRAISFRSGVGATDLLDFYATMARKAGFKPERRVDGEAQALIARRGSGGFAAYLRPDAEATVLVDLVVKDM